MSKIEDIFVKMNTNTTQNALQGFCMEAERLKAIAKAPRQEERQQRKPVRIEEGAAEQPDHLTSSSNGRGRFHGINER